MKRLGILGGTFDPIHVGHLIMASYAVDDLNLDRVLFMPAQTPPHKRDRSITSSDHRIAMVQAAIAPDARFELSMLDMQSSAPSYTADLLERMSTEHPEDELIFLIGADSLRDLPEWHRPDLVLQRAEIGVARRPGAVIDDETLDALPLLRERVSIYTSPLIDISSTTIRNRVREGRPVTWTVPIPVERYIQDHGLYR